MWYGVCTKCLVEMKEKKNGSCAVSSRSIFWFLVLSFLLHLLPTVAPKEFNNDAMEKQK